jgi:signal transduction histidine kinase
LRPPEKQKTQQSIRARLIVGGQRRVVECVFLPVEGTDMVIVQTADVTVEEERTAEHKRYVAAQGKLLEQLHTAVAIFGADHRLEFHNSAFSRLWNIEDAYLNDHPKLGDLMEKLRELRRLPEQADFRTFKKSWLDMFTGLLNPHEDMMYLPNGTAIRWLAAPHPMGGLMMTFEDITSRLALETSYNTLMAVQRETLENLAEGVSVFGSDGRLKFFNPRFMALWDLHPEDLEGEPHVAEVIEKTRKFFKLGWQDVEEILTQMGLTRREQLQQLNRDDDTVLECISVPMPDGGVMVTYRDITDKMRAEIALREKAQALEEAEKLKMDFLANVSYQLRTPLGAMTGFAEILGNRYFGDLNPKQDEYTKGILEAGQRLMTLIDDILDLSTIEAGYLGLKLETVDVGKLLREVFDLTREWAGRETLQTTLNCPPDIGFIKADARRIKQIVINLIRNAISFTPGGGSIAITAEGTGSEVRITVRDTGIGIHPDDIEKLFAPFKRSATTTALGKAAGPGLGLSLVRNIAHLHGGDAELSSTVGQGTSVTVTLPRSGPKNS